MRKYIVTTFTALAAIGALVVSSGAWAASAAETASTVNVEMWNDGSDMALKLDKNTVPAGKVTFKGVNTSTDDTVHEMLVVKVDTKIPNLPYDESAGRVPEDGIKSLGEISETKAGEKGEVTLDLKPGIYLLFCNKPGHFAFNMKTLFFVK